MLDSGSDNTQSDFAFLLQKYRHEPEEFPVFREQTHKVLRNRRIVEETIDINENIIHYIQETALLVSEIDGSLKSIDRSEVEKYDHVVFLDKSARPVSWLVNLFWDDFAIKDGYGNPVKRPRHTYISIDRVPWFRKVGVKVNDDGRKTADGELATLSDFETNLHNITPRHLAEIRALFIAGGIQSENVDDIMSTPTILDGKRLLIVDEVSRTGSTLSIAVYLLKTAVPDAQVVRGINFWHATEPPIQLNGEFIMTSLPVWYDPETIFGRGIGDINPAHYRKRYEYYREKSKTNKSIDVNKHRARAFAASVIAAPLMNPDGTVMGLDVEKRSRKLAQDMLRLSRSFKEGSILFSPPLAWDDNRIIKAIVDQGFKVIPYDTCSREKEVLKKDPLLFLNFKDFLFNQNL